MESIMTREELHDRAQDIADSLYEAMDKLASLETDVCKELEHLRRRRNLKVIACDGGEADHA
jgi:hypothetical protein